MKIIDRIKGITNQGVEYYGLGKELRRYAFFPQSLPITVTGTHGPTLISKFQDSILRKQSPFLFFMPKRMKDYDKNNKIPVRHPSQFAFYRKSNNIQPNPNGKGTVLFLSHSTKHLEKEIDFDDLFQKINELPDFYHPISFCLHFYDNREKYTKPISSAGFDYFTLTDNHFDNQIEAFYRVIPQFKYALANNFTSPVFYTIDLGLPTAILGSKQLLTNISDTDLNNLDLNNLEDELPIFKKINQVFEYPKETITEEQLDLVKEELGLDLLNNPFNRIKVSVIVWFDFFISLIRHSSQFLARKLGKK